MQRLALCFQMSGILNLMILILLFSKLVLQEQKWEEQKISQQWLNMFFGFPYLLKTSNSFKLTFLTRVT